MAEDPSGFQWCGFVLININDWSEIGYITSSNGVNQVRSGGEQL